MNTNGRSTAPTPNGHFIQTSDEKRRERWLHLFGRDTLPVIAAEPRWAEQQGRAFPVLVYDLALRQLSRVQIARFAGYLSRKYRTAYTEMLAELNGRVSYPIRATFDIQVVEPAAEQAPLASTFFEQLRTIGSSLRHLPRPRLGW